MNYISGKYAHVSDEGVTIGKAQIMPELNKKEKNKALKEAKSMLDDFCIYGKKRVEINENLTKCKTQEQINNVINRAVMQYV